MESLYAADRKLTVEVHGHLGASMSQHGARRLAGKVAAIHSNPRQVLPRCEPGEVATRS